MNSLYGWIGILCLLGNVAVVWSTYALEIEVDGKRSPDSGRVAEIFVWREGHWMNLGWHTDAGE